MPTSSAVALFVFDPGGTTGVMEMLADLRQETVASVMRRARSKRNLKTYEVKGDHVEQALELNSRLREFFFAVHVERAVVGANGLYIVIEDFHLRQMSADLSPVRVTSAFEAVFSAAHNLPSANYGSEQYIKQSASEAKGFCSNDMIKKWGLWYRRSDHERDAIRHGARRLDNLLQGK